MTTINLRDFYPWYKKDEFVKVPNKVAAELIAGKRYEEAQRRQIFYHKAHYSLDASDGIEAHAIVSYNDSPERVFELADRHCRLCRALNSLSEKQGRRIEAHFIPGMSQRKIAKSEGVNERNVRNLIRKGISGMKRFLRNL